MKKLRIKMHNCYGIESLEYDFDFSIEGGSQKAKAYAVYAPNGLMKTSFAKSFEAISNGQMKRGSTIEIADNSSPKSLKKV